MIFNFRNFYAVIFSLFILQCGFNDDEDTSPRNPQPEYTEKSPGEWEEIKEMHIPRVHRAIKSNMEKITVHVPLENTSEIHYIEVIGIMDEKRRTLVSKKFNPDQKVFTVDFPIDPSWNLKNITVYAKCSLHDTWTVDKINTNR